MTALCGGNRRIFVPLIQGPPRLTGRKRSVYRSTDNIIQVITWSEPEAANLGTATPGAAPRHGFKPIP